MNKTALCIMLVCVGALFQGCSSVNVQRFGSVIEIKADKLEEYRKLHAEVWPDVLTLLKNSNIRNYSIYLTRFDDGRYYLFSYMEYTGSDTRSDFGKLAEEPVIKKWWEVTDPMQIPLTSRAAGEHWKNMDEVFHLQ